MQKQTVCSRSLYSLCALHRVLKPVDTWINTSICNVHKHPRVFSTTIQVIRNRQSCHFTFVPLNVSRLMIFRTVIKVSDLLWFMLCVSVFIHTFRIISWEILPSTVRKDVRDLVIRPFVLFVLGTHERRTETCTWRYSARLESNLLLFLFNKCSYK